MSLDFCKFRGTGSFILGMFWEIGDIRGNELGAVLESCPEHSFGDMEGVWGV